jgi:HNH endonuclease
MVKPNKSILANLFHAKDIQAVWQASQKLNVIEHPQQGFISPQFYRESSNNKPCPYCANKMVWGSENFTMKDRTVAVARGYQYLDRSGNPYINYAGTTFFHPNYITIDHKINKARCPEKMFDYDNLELICWRCNQDKGDNNAYELQHSSKYLSSLANTSMSRYQTI